jgi:hypothetical protein
VFALWKSEDAGMALKAARSKIHQKWLASDGRSFERADEAARHEAGLRGASLREAPLEKSTFAESGDATSGLTHYDLDGAQHGIDYADPGFQADGKKRYPLDSEEHIRAAWSYIHQKNNGAPYTEAQLDHVKAKIVAAWKAEIDPKGPPAAREDHAKLAKALDEGEHETAQAIHDHAVALGAHCAGHEASEKMAGAAMAKLLARNQALEERLGAALPLLHEVKALVEKVAAQPAVMPPSRLVAIDKRADVARELDRIAEQPPALTALELIKRAVREPLPFGGRIEP